MRKRYRIVCETTGKSLTAWTTNATEIAHQAQTVFAGQSISLQVHSNNRRIIA